MKFRSWFFAGIALLPLCLPLVAYAHAFGQQYTLPLPVSFYILGGVSAFVASCAVIFLFSEPQLAENDARIYASFRLPRFTDPTLKCGGIILAAIFLVVAIFGSQNWYENPTIDLFWVWFLLGFTYVNVFVEGLWDRCNPFRTIASWVLEVGTGRQLDYPTWLGYLPAIFFFCVLIWLELFSNALGTYPIVIAAALMLYSIISNFGAATFGLDAWFSHADVFTVFFRMVGTIAPVRIVGESIDIGMPGERLIQVRAPRADFILFILFVLAATALDGLKDTAIWNLANLYYLPHWGVHLDPNIVGVAALCIVPCVFFALYAAAIAAGYAVIQTTLTFRAYLLRFGHSLIPIAIAYHFAHYFDFLIGEIQRPIPLLSDPFTKGWNLFGTKDFTINLIPIGADTVWYVQLGTIVLGHIIAAVVAHRIAVRTCATKRDVILSQLPMLVLMVFYTALGLWILSQR